MRLIGKSELYALARTKDRDLRNAVLSLAAELEAADWESVGGVGRSYPKGALAGRRLTIELDERHCAVVTFNFQLGIALVDFAGQAANVKRKRSTT